MADRRPALRRCLLPFALTLVAVGVAAALLLTSSRTADAHDEYTDWSTWTELPKGENCAPDAITECESWTKYRTLWQNTADQYQTQYVEGIPGAFWVYCSIKTPTENKDKRWIPRCWATGGGTGPDAAISFVNLRNHWRYDFFKTRTRSVIAHEHETTTTTSTVPPAVCPSTSSRNVGLPIPAGQTPAQFCGTTTTTTSTVPPVTTTTVPDCPAGYQKVRGGACEPIVVPPMCNDEPGYYRNARFAFVGAARAATAADDVYLLGGGGVADGVAASELEVGWSGLTAGARPPCVVVDHVRVDSYVAVGTTETLTGQPSVTLSHTWEADTLLRSSTLLGDFNEHNPRPSNCPWDLPRHCGGFRRPSGNPTAEMVADDVGGRFFALTVNANNNHRYGHYWGGAVTFYSPVTCPANSTAGAFAFSGLFYPGTNGAPWITNDVTTAPDAAWVAQYRANCGVGFIPDVTINTPDGYEGIYSYDDNPDLAVFHGRTWTQFAGITFTPDDLTTCEVVTRDFWVEHPTTGSNTYTNGPLLNRSCAYTVTYPTTSAHGNLRLNPNAAGHDTTVSADAPQTQATYEEAFFPPRVTINIPDGHAGGRTRNRSPRTGWALFSNVTFEQVSGPSDCEERKDEMVEHNPQVWVDAHSGYNHDKKQPQTVPRATLQLDRRCVYQVTYLTNNSPLGTERTLTLVTPVDDPDTTAREDQVAADDPNTAWDDRATAATYEHRCEKPGPFWSQVGVSLAFGDAAPEFFRGTWNPVNWSDDATRSTAFGRRPATLPPAAADVTNEGALVSLRLSLAACVSPGDGDADHQGNDWRCGRLVRGPSGFASICSDLCGRAARRSAPWTSASTYCTTRALAT